MTLSRLRVAAASLAAFLSLGAAHAADGCTYIQLAELPVNHAGPALVPTIAGALNGKPARMLQEGAVP